MTTLRFARPDLVTLPLNGTGESVTVRHELNYGETVAMYERMRGDDRDEQGRRKIDPARVPLAVIVAYLVDWTVTDPTGAVMPIRGLSADDLAGVVNNLVPSAVAALRAAIEAHADAHTEALTEEKKPMTDGTRA